MSIWGNPVMMGGSGGGGGGVAAVFVKYFSGDIITASNGSTTLTSDTSGNYLFILPNIGTWAFTSSQYGTRQVLVTEKTFLTISFYSLPYSDLATVKAYAFDGNYVDPRSDWGNLKPYLVGTSSVAQDYITLSDCLTYSPPDGESASYTAYMVYTGTNGNLSRLVSIYTSETDPGKPLWFQYNGIVGAYDRGNAFTSKSATSIHVLAISRDAATNIVKWYIDGELFRTSANYSNIPAYIYFNGTGNTFNNTIQVNLMVVVNAAESETIVKNNMTALMTKYNIPA